jgi:hypothetical protein
MKNAHLTAKAEDKTYKRNSIALKLLELIKEKFPEAQLLLKNLGSN